MVATPVWQESIAPVPQQPGASSWRFKTFKDSTIEAAKLQTLVCVPLPCLSALSGQGAFTADVDGRLKQFLLTRPSRSHLLVYVTSFGSIPAPSRTALLGDCHLPAHGASHSTETDG